MSDALNLPFNQACENNKQAILRVLQAHLPQSHKVLEIGAGTGQHATHFAANMPSIIWQCADQQQYHAGIACRVAQLNLPNLLAPIELEVIAYDWQSCQADSFFSANTAHIMPWPAVVAMFAGVGSLIGHDGVFILYGPFNRQGEFTSDSNRAFHYSLLNRDPAMGIRDDRAIIDLAASCGMQLCDDIDMPANNRILICSKCR